MRAESLNQEQPPVAEMNCLEIKRADRKNDSFNQDPESEDDRKGSCNKQVMTQEYASN